MLSHQKGSWTSRRCCSAGKNEFAQDFSSEELLLFREEIVLQDFTQWKICFSLEKKSFPGLHVRPVQLGGCSSATATIPSSPAPSAPTMCLVVAAMTAAKAYGTSTTPG